MQQIQNLKISKVPNSEVEIIGFVLPEELKSYRTKAIKYFSARMKIDGFRQGKIPESIVISKVGEVALLEESAELFLREMIPKLFVEEKIKSLGRPELIITKLVPENPVEFKIKVAVLPEFTLPDYKKISEKIVSKKIVAPEVTEKELEEAIKNIRISRSGKKDEKDEKQIKDEDLPVFDDAFVKTLGDFKDTTDFKDKIKANLLEEKKHRVIEKKRIEISDELVKESEIVLPEILIENELEKMWSQFEYNILRMGIKIEDYVKHTKKDKETLKIEWRADAEKNAKLELILFKIAEAEKIVPAEQAVNDELVHVLEHYKEADPERARAYIERTHTNQAVFAFLEKA